MDRDAMLRRMMNLCARGERCSADIRRKLAEAYMVAEQYDDALREYRAVAEKLGVTDPVLDKQIEKAYLAGLNQALAALEQNPQDYEKPEEQIESFC